MVIHPRSPVGSSSGKIVQVLASKPDLFKLSINAHGMIDWSVMLAGTMVTATTKTVLKAVVPGELAAPRPLSPPAPPVLPVRVLNRSHPLSLTRIVRPKLQAFQADMS